MEEKLLLILKNAEEIEYGFIAKDGTIHHNAKMKYYLSNYHFSSVEDTLKYKIGTCYEKTEVIRYYLEKSNISCKTYNIIYDVEGKIARHTFCVVEYDGMFYLMESSWILNDNSFKFKSLEDLLLFVIRKYPKMYKIEGLDISKIEIYEYDKPPVGLDFYSFTEYIRSCNRITIDLSKVF